MKRIGCLGLGFMGKGMASNILKSSSHKLSVFDIDSSKLQYFRDIINQTNNNNRLTVTNTIEELALTSDIICLSLPSENSCHTCLFDDKNGLLSYWSKHNSSNKIIIDHGTFSNQFSTITHSICQDKDVNYIDAPVSGGPTGAANGTLTIMVGAKSEQDFHNVKSILDCMGKNVIYCGKPGMYLYILYENMNKYHTCMNW